MYEKNTGQLFFHEESVYEIFTVQRFQISPKVEKSIKISKFCIFVNN